MEFPKSPLEMIVEPGTSKPCRQCKWVTGGLTDPKQGRCTVNRAKSGAIWQRMIRDIDNTTCVKWDKGVLSFRDNA
ncbi:MAG: benzylsuccinate synthase beta subunit family protein [Syntrophobacteraceae bacterium]